MRDLLEKLRYVLRFIVMMCFTVAVSYGVGKMYYHLLH